MHRLVCVGGKGCILACYTLFAVSAVVKQQIPAGFFDSYTVAVFYFIEEYTRGKRLQLLQKQGQNISKRNMTALLPSLKDTDSTSQSFQRQQTKLFCGIIKEQNKPEPNLGTLGIKREFIL